MATSHTMNFDKPSTESLAVRYRLGPMREELRAVYRQSYPCASSTRSIDYGALRSMWKTSWPLAAEVLAWFGIVLFVVRVLFP